MTLRPIEDRLAQCPGCHTIAHFFSCPTTPTDPALETRQHHSRSLRSCRAFHSLQICFHFRSILIPSLVSLHSHRDSSPLLGIGGTIPSLSLLLFTLVSLSDQEVDLTTTQQHRTTHDLTLSGAPLSPPNRCKKLFTRIG